MVKYKITITSERAVRELNEKIALDSLFYVGETITNSPLHLGKNVVTDERIIESAKEYANAHYITVQIDLLVNKAELLAAYERTIVFYNTHNINRKFSKYAELFWLLFDDDTRPYMWAVDNVCTLFPECNKEKLEKELDRYI